MCEPSSPCRAHAQRHSCHQLQIVSKEKKREVIDVNQLAGPQWKSVIFLTWIDMEPSLSDPSLSIKLVETQLKILRLKFEKFMRDNEALICQFAGLKRPSNFIECRDTERGQVKYALRTFLPFFGFLK